MQQTPKAVVTRADGTPMKALMTYLPLPVAAQLQVVAAMQGKRATAFVREAIEVALERAKTLPTNIEGIRWQGDPEPTRIPRANDDYQNLQDQARDARHIQNLLKRQPK